MCLTEIFSKNIFNLTIIYFPFSKISLGKFANEIIIQDPT